MQRYVKFIESYSSLNFLEIFDAKVGPIGLFARTHDDCSFVQTTMAACHSFIIETFSQTHTLNKEMLRKIGDPDGFRLTDVVILKLEIIIW